MNQETVIETTDVRTLSEVVCAVLKQQDHPNPEGWKRFLELPEGKIEPVIEEALVRRALMNVLSDASVNGEAPLNTIEERMAVVTAADRVSWIRIFTLRVAPCMVKNNLPPTKH